MRHHGLRDGQIAVTGAPRFDAFFAMTPHEPRDVFFRRYRLDPGQPLVTYLCSSEFVAGGEPEFVRRWVDEVLRDPRLAAANVLIRPHPRLVDQWNEPATAKQFAALERVGVAASRGMNADQLLYDTLFHSAAVVGLNTSAQIEAGVLGKPVYTLRAPGFEGGQAGTLHFHYLLREHGGFVESSEDFEGHRAALSAAVEGRYDADAIRRFVESFVRPHGLAREATPYLAEAIEALAATGVDHTSGAGPRAGDELAGVLHAARQYIRRLRKQKVDVALPNGAALPAIEAVCSACHSVVRNHDLGKMLRGLGEEGLEALDELLTLAVDETVSRS